MPTEQWRPAARPDDRTKIEGRCSRCGRDVYLANVGSSVIACWGCDELVGDCYCPELAEAA